MVRNPFKKKKNPFEATRGSMSMTNLYFCMHGLKKRRNEFKEKSSISNCLACPNGNIVWMYVLYARFKRKNPQGRKYTSVVIVKDGSAGSIWSQERLFSVPHR
jgi:hypothetical protein